MVATIIILGFLFIIIGLYILGAIFEFISQITGVNISFIEYLMNFIFKIWDRLYEDKLFPLQKLIGSIYSVVVEILLWLIPIAGFIAAGILLAEGGSNFHIGYALLGIIAGLLLDVILYSPIVLVLNIRKSIKTIENN